MHPSPLDALIQIVTHVPVWVWVILAVLIVLGTRQSRPQQVTRKRLLVLPLVWLVFGAWGVQRGFGQASSAGVAILAWAGGLLASVGALVATGWPGKARFEPADGLYRVPGSWLPLGVMLAIFCARFAVGMALAVQPGLAHSAMFAAAASLSFGLLSGFFVGRSINILRRGPWMQVPQSPMAA